MFICHVDILVCEVPVHIFYPFSCLIGVSVFFLLVLGVIYMFCKEFFVRYIYHRYFLPLGSSHFHPMNSSFWWTEIFNSNVVQFINLSLILSAFCILLNKYQTPVKSGDTPCLIFMEYKTETRRLFSFTFQHQKIIPSQISFFPYDSSREDRINYSLSWTSIIVCITFIISIIYYLESYVSSCRPSPSHSHTPFTQLSRFFMIFLLNPGHDAF